MAMTIPNPSSGMLGSQGVGVSSLLEKIVDGETTGLGIAPAPTGFHPLDMTLDGGFLPGELVLLGGQPAVGKTLSALQWARNIAREQRPVVFACFEHDEHSLLGRLLSQELALIGPDLDSTAQVHARDQIRALMMGLVDLDHVVETQPVVRQALESLYETAPEFQLVRASSHWTTPDALTTLVTDHLRPGGVLFVDYLQKVPIPGATGLAERVFRATEEMKELATTYHITVVALASADNVGIGADRLRMDHLRGSDALAHEADIAMILNEKSTATSPNHLEFDLTQLQKAKSHVVLSIEKNRRGQSDVHLEFRKDFGNYRLDPAGGFVAETLRGD